MFLKDCVCRSTQSFYRCTNQFRRFQASVAVGLSGGVDSCVSAYLLKQQGYDVTGIFMKNWSVEEETGKRQCPMKDDLLDAEKIAAKLQIPLKIYDFQKEYWNNVFEVCLEQYEAGETPNPDVLCNRYIKFDVFANRCFSEGFDYIATGHYCRVSRDPISGLLATGPELLRGSDTHKDQSYFLSQISGNILNRVLFPVGSFKKADVKTIARNAGFDVYKKKESMGICFIGERNMKQFLSEYITPTPGNIVSPAGEVFGHHAGLPFYTIGQKIPMPGFRTRHFVCAKRVSNNELVVCEEGSLDLFRTTIQTFPSSICWLHEAYAPAVLSVCEKEEFPLECQLRYQTEKYPCRMEKEGEKWVVRSVKRMRAVTPGQVCVLYRGDVCLGGFQIHCFVYWT